MLDSVRDVDSHPHLVRTTGNNDETGISHAYMKILFENCDSYIARTMKGLDLISFSIPKHRLSLLKKNAVPVMAILHGTHEISLHIIQAMLGCIDGFW